MTQANPLNNEAIRKMLHLVSVAPTKEAMVEMLTGYADSVDGIRHTLKGLGIVTGCRADKTAVLSLHKHLGEHGANKLIEAGNRVLNGGGEAVPAWKRALAGYTPTATATVPGLGDGRHLAATPVAPVRELHYALQYSSKKMPKAVHASGAKLAWGFKLKGDGNIYWITSEGACWHKSMTTTRSGGSVTETTTWVTVPLREVVSKSLVNEAYKRITTDAADLLQRTKASVDATLAGLAS